MDGEVAVPTGLMSCSKLPDDVKNVVNATIQAVSNVQSCVSTELQTAGNDVQVIVQSVRDLLKTARDITNQVLSQNTGSILDKIRNAPKVSILNNVYCFNLNILLKYMFFIKNFY